MAERLEPMRRLPQADRRAVLHCDPTVAAYLKVLLDALFGARNFRNENRHHRNAHLVTNYTGGKLQDVASDEEHRRAIMIERLQVGGRRTGASNGDRSPLPSAVNCWLQSGSRTRLEHEKEL